MTGFDELERGDIVWRTDPLSEKIRPLLILGAPNLPAHDVQLITDLDRRVRGARELDREAQ